MCDGRFLTVAEMAQVLRTSPRELYRLIQRGDVPALRIGRQLRLMPAEVIAAVRAAPEAGTGRAVIR